jgi:hypothetical protein
MQECRKDHSRCRWKDLSSQFHPTRLVDLGEARGIVYPKLVLPGTTVDGEETSCYVTLSHCWGSAVPLSLRESFFAEMLEGISTAGLSRTFRGATESARQMGFRYIWIDSLCIVQDNEDEWRREAAMMTDIYRHSSLDIASADAYSGDDGCYRSRAPIRVEPVTIDLSFTFGRALDGERTQTVLLQSHTSWYAQTSFLLCSLVPGSSRTHTRAPDSAFRKRQAALGV